MERFKEGKVEFKAPKGKISKKLTVFFNPKMELNRDISVWLVKNLKLKKGCCPMAGSGVRALRLNKEVGMDITANDLNPEASKLIEENAKLNNIKLKVENKDANILLREEMFDYVDIDPFGTPVPFLDSAVYSLKNGAVLAITATDLACLTGHYVKPCLRKYLSRSLKCGFSREIGIRILIKRVQEAALAHSKALIPVFSHCSDHYFRVYFRCGEGNKQCDEIIKQHKRLYYCPKCLNSNFHGTDCCGQIMMKGGPLWVGKLWDISLKSFDRIRFIKEEADVGSFGYYNIPKICRKLKIPIKLKINDLIAEIQKLGYKVSRTHFEIQGVRSNIGVKELTEILKMG